MLRSKKVLSAVPGRMVLMVLQLGEMVRDHRIFLDEACLSTKCVCVSCLMLDNQIAIEAERFVAQTPKDVCSATGRWIC